MSQDGHTQLLALDGTVIEEQRYKSESKLTNGNSIVETFDDSWGLTDSNDLEIVIPIYDSIIVLDANFLKVKKGNGWGIITSTGQIIADPIYRSVDSFDGKYFEVTKPNETRGWGYLSGKIDTTGEPVSEAISQTRNDVFITKSFEKLGLEKNDKVIIPHIYDNLSYWGDDKYIAQKDNKFGIVDSNNKVLLNFEYTSISPLKDGKSTIKRGTLQNEIDSNLKIVEDMVIELPKGYKKIKLGGKWGILNPNGEVIVDYLYDEISTFRGRLVGIINGRLIKLNAYYPYKLPMDGQSLGIKENRDLITIGGVVFQNSYRRHSIEVGKKENMVLLNWTQNMRFPIVMPLDKIKKIKKAKHIDKPDDFVVGDTYQATITSIKKFTSGKVKALKVKMQDGKNSSIYLNDLIKTSVDASRLEIGTNIYVTKMGYNEELDRTKWRIDQIVTADK
ncbi:MAG: WG repeat-containing protein [Muribaculaceae bacterium]|nr:WG repeat-containing protein [Muribaculaceae bacterium]